MKERKARLKEILQDSTVSLLIFAGVTVCSTFLAQFFDDNNPFAVSLYILAVALIARFTRGYGYGIAASLGGVFCVNYIFTYPFYKFNLSIAGYPLTFTAMLLVAVIISTLTTRIKLQEQLRFEVEKEKMRSDLLRSISHDLRTPLTSILGASSVLLENRQISDSDRLELTGEINKDAKWLIRVTENILSMTKLGSGEALLKKEEEVVEEIVGSAIVKFRQSPESVPVRVIKPEQILLVPMEPTLIRQVLLNIFENAVLHGETTAGICVTISCERGKCVFCVADDGAGIPPDILPRLFNGDLNMPAGQHSDGRRSMGIGLSVCRSIIRAHGGDISAGNNAGKGAYIRFWLPYGEKE